jgi:hypothetical protein
LQNSRNHQLSEKITKYIFQFIGLLIEVRRPWGRRSGFAKQPESPAHLEARNFSVRP